MKVTIGYKSDEQYYAENEQGNRLEIDMLAPEEKQAMSPMQLLLAGVGACAAVDLVKMVKKRRKTLTDFSAVAEGNRREEFPKKFTDVHVKFILTSPDLEESEAEKLVDLAVEKYCSVAATINESTKLTHSFEIVRP